MSIIACEQVFIADDPENTPINNFEELWTTIDQKYSFFEYKNIDWDSVYAVYRPQVHDNMEAHELFDVLADMLFELRDGHVNLRASFNLSRNWEWYLNYPENFNFQIIEREYLGDDHYITGPFRAQVIDSIGYIYYGSFANTISPSHIDFLVSRFRHLDGIIIDVRNNGGGMLSNADLLVSRFADERKLTLYRLYKEGPGHNEFSEPIPHYIEPEGDRQFTDRPVVVLTNRRSYSATNNFVQQMRAFPQVTVIGDTTGGGGGSPFNAELMNGWQYRFSSNQTLAPDGRNIESGIGPDINVDLSHMDYVEKRDSIIEEALDFIRNR